MIQYIDMAETFIFIVLLCASVLALGVFIERYVILRKDTGKKSKTFYESIVTALRKDNIDEAKNLVKTAQDSSYYRMASFSLDHYRKGRSALSEIMQGKIIKERVELEKRLAVLGTLGNNAPFIGLLGTVLGVIKAFYDLGTLGSSGTEVVMRSISSALLATAAGLFVAIPVVIANNFLARKIYVIMNDLEIMSKEFMGTFHNEKEARRNGFE